MYMKGIFLNTCMLLKLVYGVHYIKETNDMLNYFNHFKYTRFNKFILFCIGNNTFLLMVALHIQNLNGIYFSDIKMA